VSIHQNTGSTSLTIAFADGTETQANVVIGADGIHSVVRSHVVEGEVSRNEDDSHKAVRTAFTNTLAYRGLISVDDLKKAGLETDLTEWPMSFCGHDKVSASFRYRIQRSNDHFHDQSISLRFRSRIKQS
jgi:salicylate hydroxylase